jgi:molecular chaperone GrpE (heat shock protein)
MENTIILQLIGFVICFILLFVFVAKYRTALAQDKSLDDEVEEISGVRPSGSSFQSRASLIEAARESGALELADLKEQVKNLHYRLEELKMAHDKSNGDIAKQMARLEQRLSTFEQEYVTKLQPTLLRVIDELEHVKSEETPEKPEPEK